MVDPPVVNPGHPLAPYVRDVLVVGAGTTDSALLYIMSQDRISVPGTAWRCPSCHRSGYSSWTKPEDKPSGCPICQWPNLLTADLLPNPRNTVHKDSLPDSVYVETQNLLREEDERLARLDRGV